MFLMRSPLIVAAVAIAGGASGSAAADELFDSLNRAPVVFVGKLAGAQAGPVGRSLPPVYTFRLTFDEQVERLRGPKPASLAMRYSIRTMDPPRFDVGRRYVVAAADDRIARVLPAEEKHLRLARQAVSVPLGWTLSAGKPVSPWAARGEDAWPKDAELKADIVCSRSGRPALPAGEGIKLKVKQVPPKKLQKFRNPYGDGFFKITVSNTGKMALSVPALLQDGDDIRWHESLIAICRDRPYLLPRTGPLKDPAPVELGPGESVSTTIDAMLLGDDVPWPRGGSRIGFTFGLGEVAADSFFYYYSQLHDPLRKERQQAFDAAR